MSAPLNIDEAFAKLLADNGLSSLSLTFSTTQTDDARFSASVQWQGYSRDGYNCVFGYDATASGAIRKALSAAAADRVPGDADVPTMEMVA